MFIIYVAGGGGGGAEKVLPHLRGGGGHASFEGGQGGGGHTSLTLPAGSIYFGALRIVTLYTEIYIYGPHSMN